jgi:hypothetical protein
MFNEVTSPFQDVQQGLLGKTWEGTEIPKDDIQAQRTRRRWDHLLKLIAKSLPLGVVARAFEKYMFHALHNSIGTGWTAWVGSLSISIKDLVGLDSIEAEASSQFGYRRTIMNDIELAANGVQLAGLEGLEEETLVGVQPLLIA